MKVQIKPYSNESLDQINALILHSKASWRYTQEQLALWKDELKLTPKELRTRHIFIGSHLGQLILLYSLSELSPDSCELEDCWITPEFKGQGFGRAIFNHAREQMKLNHWLTMKIVADPFAKGFYIKMGARSIGKTPSQPEGRTLPVLEWTP